MESRQENYRMQCKRQSAKATGNQGKIITEGKRQKARWSRGKIIQKAKTNMESRHDNYRMQK